MSKYFEPIDTELKGKDKPQVEVTNPIIIKDISNILDKIKEEVHRLETGNSIYSSFAIQFPKGKSPLKECIKNLESVPTKRGIETLLVMTEQELNKRVAEYFASLFQREGIL